MAQFIQFPIDASATVGGPSVFQTLLNQSVNVPADAVTPSPSIIDTEIQDQVTLSQQALSSSSTSNLFTFANPTNATLPIEAASTGIAPVHSQFEQLVYDGVQLPLIGFQLALDVANFENTIAPSTLNVAA